jgi:hypothetical protein
MNILIRHGLRSADRVAVINFTKRNQPMVYGLSQTSSFSRVVRRKKKSDDDNVRPPPPVPTDPKDAWVDVVDKTSGQVYYWNTITNETTVLGAPKPTGPTAISPQGQQTIMVAQAQQPSAMGGLGRVVAEGFAFGTGAHLAGHMVGSFFGGGSGGHSSGGDIGGGGGDSFDI